MASDFRKLPKKFYAKPKLRKESREQNYWKAFQFPTVVKDFSAINHIQYSPLEPYHCLVTSSAKVQIFDSDNAIKRTSNRTKENVYGARYRYDGKLMVTGGESGLVQVLDVNSRSILRNFKAHTKACHVSSFSKEASKIFSAADDKYVRYWDLPTGKELLNIKQHKDYIRCGCIDPANNDLFITGSYDHKVKVWDIRSNSTVMEMNHGAPVESVIMHENNTVCVSAGSNYIKVWDVLGGTTTLYKQFSNHQKTITTMCFNGDGKRLLSGGLDRYVKIYDVIDYSLVATINYPSPVLAMDLSADGNHLAVGMSDGAVSFRHRASNAQNKPVSRKRDFPFQSGTYKHRVRNQNSKAFEDDVVVKRQDMPTISKSDRCLQKFRYREALDITLKNIGTFPSYAMSLIIELSRRDALDFALSNRDANGLEDIMNFLIRNVTIPRYAPILIPVADMLIDKYAKMIGDSKSFDSSLKRLSAKITEALQPHRDMMKILGALDQMFCMMTPPPPMSTLPNDLNDLPKENTVTDEVELLNDSVDIIDILDSENSSEVDFQVKSTEIMISQQNE